MTALDKLRRSREFLEAHGIPDAGREAELIIASCLGGERAILYRDDPQINQDIIDRIDEILSRRAAREPLQYILGCTEFYGLKIRTGRGVLIPRPETELLVEEAVKIISTVGVCYSRRTFNLLDLCTGSGCIALALAKEFPDSRVYGTDMSRAAIGYAEENARINGVGNVTFLHGSLFRPIEESFVGLEQLLFDLIVSNPPYIERSALKKLQPEIRDWEPVEALDGGVDGLDYYRMIIPEAKQFLNEHGALILELGEGQAEAVRRMAEEAAFGNTSVKNDFCGIERILIAGGE